MSELKNLPQPKSLYIDNTCIGTFTNCTNISNQMVIPSASNTQIYFQLSSWWLSCYCRYTQHIHIYTQVCDQNVEIFVGHLKWVFKNLSTWSFCNITLPYLSYMLDGIKFQSTHLNGIFYQSSLKVGKTLSTNIETLFQC